MYRLAHERSGHKCADEKRFIAKMATATVFRALPAGRASGVSVRYALASNRRLTIRLNCSATCSIPLFCATT